MENQEVQVLIQELLSNPEKLRAELEELYPATIAEALYDLEPEVVQAVLDSIPPELSGEVFSLLEPDTQDELVDTLSSDELAELMTIMSADDRVDLVKRLPEEMADAALALMDDEEREDITQLSAYEEGTVGSIMTSEYVQLAANLTAEQAIAYLRQEAADSETIYISYITDKANRLLGSISLKNLILAKPQEKITEIMNTDIILIHDQDDQELAADKIAQYDLLALPVVDSDERLVGIVTHDDVIDVLNQEHTEDMEKFMGITGKHEDMAYLRTPIWVHFRNRIGWIMGLAVLGFVSGMVLKGFEDVLSNLMVLALFMPMLADTGGNMGSQSATVVIRALALKEITLRDAFRVLGKELTVSFMTALILAVIAFVRVWLLAGDSDIPAGISLVSIGGVISLALGLQVVSSTAIGSLLPMAAVRLKLDPAVVASPAITTIVDVTGILIYFSLARHMLGV